LDRRLRWPKDCSRQLAAKGKRLRREDPVEQHTMTFGINLTITESAVFSALRIDGDRL
jgi:hypothetical protein